MVLAFGCSSQPGGARHWAKPVAPVSLVSHPGKHTQHITAHINKYVYRKQTAAADIQVTQQAECTVNSLRHHVLPKQLMMKKMTMMLRVPVAMNLAAPLATQLRCGCTQHDC